MRSNLLLAASDADVKLLDLPKSQSFCFRLQNQLKALLTSRPQDMLRLSLPRLRHNMKRAFSTLDSKAVSSLLRSMVGSVIFNFLNCSSFRESASVYHYYLPKILLFSVMAKGNA